jgi:DNA repair protein RecO (recombination protein O)
VSLVKDAAIVLRRLDYSETSQVLALFTREHGQQRLIAKGVKRGTKTRVAVGLDLLEFGHVVFSLRPGKEEVLAPLAEWRQEDTFPHVRGDLKRLYAAQYAAEVTSQLTETHDPHPLLFDGLREFLARLATAEPLATLVDYLAILLTEIGLRPDFSRCVSCNRDIATEAAPHFSSREGGAICRDCEPAMIEKRRVSPAVLRWLAAGHAGDSAATRAGSDAATGSNAATLTAAAFDLLDYHLREIMHKPARLSVPLRTAFGLPKKF